MIVFAICHRLRARLGASYLVTIRRQSGRPSFDSAERITLLVFPLIEINQQVLSEYEKGADLAAPF